MLVGKELQYVVREDITDLYITYSCTSFNTQFEFYFVSYMIMMTAV